MAGNRNATGYLKTAIVRRLRSEFNTTRVPGITEIPTIIQDRIIDSLPYPIIYVDISSVEEVNVTKMDSAYEYVATLSVINRTTQKEDGKAVRDAIVDEVTNIMDCPVEDYLDLTNDGFNVYVQTVTSPDPQEPVNAYGATYWNTEIDILFRVDFIGLPSTNQPLQQAQYTFAGFEFQPTGRDIEQYDSGTITGATTYPSNNNGYDFTGVNYVLTTGSEGTLTDNILTVAPDDDPLGLIATIAYEFNTDTTITTTVSDTDNFPRIKSLRYGSRDTNSVSSADLQDFSLWTGTNQVVDFGNVNPTGTTITLSGNQGQYLYIVHDANNGITGLRDSLGTDNINNFDLTEIDGYRVLILDRTLAFNNFSITLDIT